MFTSKERELLLKAISNEQISMIMKDHNAYADDDYNELEKLKIKIKDIRLSPVDIWNRVYTQNAKLFN